MSKKESNMEILNREFLGNTILDYCATALIVIGGIILVFVIKAFVFARLQKRAEKTKGKFDDLLVNTLGKTLIPALYYAVIYISLIHLKLNTSFERLLDVAGIVLLTFLSIRFLMSLISYSLSRYFERFDDETKKRDVKAIMPILKVIIYGIGIFFLLDNLGFKISTLVAGLGIGGVAIALACQAVLGDLFSYFSILFDKPFEIGDFITVDAHMGVVEHIGIKTTRIKSISGEQLVFSNSDLTKSRVKNYKRMQQRRVAFKIGVIYQTTLEQLKEIPAIMKGIIEGIADTKFDRSHFQAYGNFSLDFESVYYVHGADFNKYMDTQQAINLKLFDEFAKRGIEFAYPTQTLFIDKT